MVAALYVQNTKTEPRLKGVVAERTAGLTRRVVRSLKWF